MSPLVVLISGRPVRLNNLSDQSPFAIIPITLLLQALLFTGTDFPSDSDQVKS